MPGNLPICGYSAARPDFSAFAAKLGCAFKDLDLLIEALTHRSYLNEHRTAGSHNERLEFLGDAVLELATTRFLFDRFPNKPEGDLTAYRAALVNTNSIAEVAEGLGVNDMLLLSKGERKDTGRARQIILANAFEAILGAIYLDQGYEAADGFLAAHLYPKIDGVIATRVGYTGGEVRNATYRNHGNHAEAIEIIFDPEKISYRDLLEFFFQIHDPTTRNRQGNDIGTSYRSAIFYTSEEQKRVALDTIADVDASGLWPGKVVTEVTAAGPFWEAEPEHQDYLERIPNGYTCHFIRPDWKLPVRAEAHEH